MDVYDPRLLAPPFTGLAAVQACCSLSRSRRETTGEAVTNGATPHLSFAVIHGCLWYSRVAKCFLTAPAREMTICHIIDQVLLELISIEI